MAADDSVQVAAVAHKLKGSAGSMAGLELAAACRDLEHLGRAGDLDGAAPLLAAVEAAYADFDALLDAACAAAAG